MPCAAHFDPVTGVEDDECAVVIEPRCTVGSCGSDGACHVDNLPAGQACGIDEVCNGSGSCVPVPPCDPTPCNDEHECTIDSCNSDGTCVNDPQPSTMVCSAGKGHCNPSDGTCCTGVLKMTNTPNVYACAEVCPLGQKPDPKTWICRTPCSTPNDCPMPASSVCGVRACDNSGEHTDPGLPNGCYYVPSPPSTPCSFHVGMITCPGNCSGASLICEKTEPNCGN